MKKIIFILVACIFLLTSCQQGDVFNGATITKDTIFVPNNPRGCIIVEVKSMYSNLSVLYKDTTDLRVFTLEYYDGADFVQKDACRYIIKLPNNLLIY